MSATIEPMTLDQVSTLAKFEVNKIDQIVDAVRSEALSLAVDVTTKKGRDELKSQAYKVSQTKTHLVKLANASIEEHRAIVSSVTSERVRLERELDAIRDEVKKPAIEWETKEESRKAEIKSKIDALESYGMNLSEMSASALHERMLTVAKGSQFDFQEFSELAEETEKRTTKNLIAAFNSRTEYEAEQAELKRLREEKEKRDAEEAARKAEDERKAAELKAAQEAKAKAERDAREAEERETQRKAEESKRIEEAKLKAVEAERDRLLTEQAAKAKAETLRLEAEKEKQLQTELAEAKRKADETHRNKIRQEASLAIRELINNAESYRTEADLVTAIERGEIPHVSINF